MPNGVPNELLTVRAIMTPDVFTISMDASVGHVVQVFEDNGFNHIIVEDDGKCVGVLSDRDMLRTISPFVGTNKERAMDEFTANRRVHQVMARNVASVSPDTSIAEACELMYKRKIHCLPVLAPDRSILGIITASDVLAWTARQLGQWLERKAA